MARRVINPTVVKSAGDAALDQILKLSSQIATENAKNRRQTELISFQKSQDTLKAQEKAKENDIRREDKFKDEYYDNMMTYINGGDFDTALTFLGEKPDQPGVYTYNMARNSMVTNTELFPTAEEFISMIEEKRQKSLTGENLTRSWLSRDKSINKSDVYDKMLKSYADGDMTKEEFDFAMKIGQKQPWFSSLGLSKTEIKGGPSRDAMQADIKTTIGIFNTYKKDNFYTPAKGFEWAQSTYGAEGFSNMLREAGIKSTDTEGIEKYTKNLWRAKVSSPNAREAMETMKVSALEGGSGDKSLFELYGEGVKPGQSSGQQFLVNTFFGLAIESDPELRGVNDRNELLQKLSDPNTQERIVRIVEEYLGPYETWSDYMATKDKPNSKFRIRLIED